MAAKRKTVPVATTPDEMPEAVTLDRSRPFGVIHGIHAGRYVQDGAIFDAEGYLLELGREQQVAPAITADTENASDSPVADEAALAALSQGE